MIPLLKPSYSDAEIEGVTEVLKSGWWGMGPKCEEFERQIADKHGYRYAVTVNSATAALHLALIAHGVGPGDEVIVPALTFISTALAVVYTGAQPVFADVYKDSLCMDWQDVEAKTTAKTKAVIPVDYAGYPAGRAELIGPVIQDAAHATGGLMYGDTVCLSFHPVKNLGTGDGGAILTNNAEHYKRLKSLRWCGIDKSTHERNKDKYGWDYNIREIGYKCHWNDIQAAIGLAQLIRLDKMLQRRTEIAKAYHQALDSLVSLPKPHIWHTWHLYPVRVEKERRNAIIDYMLSQGVSAGVHYKPLTLYPMWRNLGTPMVTAQEWQRLISLPIYADMKDYQIEKVINALIGALKNA